MYVYAILSTVALFSFTGPCNFPSKNKLPKQQEIGESNHVTFWCHGRAKKTNQHICRCRSSFSLLPSQNVSALKALVIFLFR